MRFNDKELAELARKKPDLEGRLNYKGPAGSFRDSGYKDRWFKLKANFLFYFRLNEVGSIEDDPAGVIVLENAIVQHEMYSEMPFAFSLRFSEDPEKKHLFSGSTENQVNQWVANLQKASYDFWRRQLVQLQVKLKAATGKDPLQVMPHNKGQIRSSPELKPSKSPRQNRNLGVSQRTSSFQSHLLSSAKIDPPVPPPTRRHQNHQSPQHTQNPQNSVPIGNLIDLS